MLILLVATLVLLGGSLWAPAVAQDAVVVYAAGSLRAALTEIAERFTAQSSIAVRLEFGASGTLRQRLEQGEAADVFASAKHGASPGARVPRQGRGRQVVRPQ